MENRIFNNSRVLAWLEYFSANTDVDLEHVKIQYWILQGRIRM